MPVRSPFAAITLDLDDTLWPTGPTIRRAEAAGLAWFDAHAPEMKNALPEGGLPALRRALLAESPERAHDLRWLRQAVYTRALTLAGYGAEPAREAALQAFAAFDAERQRVEFFPDALPALEALAARYPLLSLSNGFADLERIGVGHLFRGGISAVDFGVAKPHPDIFHAGCAMLGVEPAQVLHVGDDIELDVLGALDAGMSGAWINRRGAEWKHARAPTAQFANLEQLVQWLA